MDSLLLVINKNCINNKSKWFCKWRERDIKDNRSYCYQFYKEYKLCDSCDKYLQNIYSNQHINILEIFSDIDIIINSKIEEYYNKKNLIK